MHKRLIIDYITLKPVRIPHTLSPSCAAPQQLNINVTTFSSISYYSNVRLISKIELEQNFQSITIFNSCHKLSFGVVHKIRKGVQSTRSKSTNLIQN